MFQKRWIQVFMMLLFFFLTIPTFDGGAEESENKQGHQLATADTAFISGGCVMQAISGFAEINGTSLYYETAGSGDPIVLIHGNFGDRRYWDDQFEAFAKNHSVLRYDVRGFGKSSDPVAGEPWAPQEDLKALLAYCGMSKAHIAGFSMGCGQAVDFVLSHPEMCHSLIAVGPWATGYKMPEEDQMAMTKVGSVLEEGGPGAAAEYIANMPFFNAHKMPSKVKERFAKIAYDYSVHRSSRSPNFRNAEQRLTPPAVQRLAEIDLPTLIITSEYDVTACKEIADLMDREIPHAQKVEIAGVTHFMMMEKPEEFNRIVLNFCANIKDMR